MEKLEQLGLVAEDCTAHLEGISGDGVIALAHIYAVPLGFVVDEGGSAVLALSGLEVEVFHGRIAGNTLVEVVVVRRSDGAILDRCILGLDIIVEVVPVVGGHACVDEVCGCLGSEEIVVDLLAGVGGGVEVELVGAARALLLCEVEEVVRSVALDAGSSVVEGRGLGAGNVGGGFFGLR